MAAAGRRLYIDGVLASEVKESSLCVGVWSFGSNDYGNGGRTLRDGIHVGGGYGVSPLLVLAITGAILAVMGSAFALVR